MISIALRALALAALALIAAWHRETTLETDLRHDHGPGASAAGLPPYAPDSPESTYSERSVRDLATVLVPRTAPMPPFINDTAQALPRRAQHNWAAMDTGNGRDAEWMAYAAAQAAR